MEVLFFILITVGTIALIMARSGRRNRRRPRPRYLSPDRPQRRSSEPRYTSYEDTPAADLEFSDYGTAHIRSLDIEGRYIKSQNGQYAVIFDSGYGEQYQDQDGRMATRWIPGAFALVQNGNVIVSDNCPRPDEAAVSNNGNFVICELGDIGELKTTVHAYSTKTGLKTATEVQALPNCVGISDDGGFLAVQFCNSRSEDSGKLVLWNVDLSERIASFEPETGWPDKIRFRVTERVIILEYEKVGKKRSYRYSFDGEFLDRERYRIEEIEDASVSQMDYIIRRRFKDAAEEDLPGLRALIDDTLSRSFAGEPGYLASAYRLKGEIHEAMDERLPAIAAYERALDLNPKVGVKNRLKKLKKRQCT